MSASGLRPVLLEPKLQIQFFRGMFFANSQISIEILGGCCALKKRLIPHRSEPANTLIRIGMLTHGTIYAFITRQKEAFVGFRILEKIAIQQP